MTYNAGLKRYLVSAMMYSGDWVNDHYPKREYYAYMTRGFRLVKAASGK